MSLDDSKKNKRKDSDISRSTAESVLNRELGVTKRLLDTAGYNFTQSASQELHRKIQSLIPRFTGFQDHPTLKLSREIGEYSRSICNTPEIAAAGNLFKQLEESHFFLIVRQLEESPFFAITRQVGLVAESIESRLKHLSAPAMAISNLSNSISGYLKLEIIGTILLEQQTYEEKVVDAFRLEFGDWRDPITFREEASENTRRSLYEKQGFDEELVDFSDEGFGEIIEVTNIKRPLSEIENIFGPLIPEGMSDRASTSEHERQAYDWLRSLETAIRIFIDKVMHRAFGEDWPKHRLPNNLYKDWCEKRHQSTQNGYPPRPIIDYADFSDYLRIIEKKDNWSSVFSSYWVRQEDIRESFQRLRAARNNTMHARAVLKEDLIIIYSEGRRVFQVLAKEWTKK